MLVCGPSAKRATKRIWYLVITLWKAGCEKSKIREIKEGFYKLPGTGSIEWVRPFTRRFQCLFGWDATVEEACKQNDTKKLAQLLPGADAVEPAMLPAVAQMASGSLPMIEDCRHWTWATTDGSEGEAKVRFRQSTLYQEFPLSLIHI